MAASRFMTLAALAFWMLLGGLADEAPALRGSPASGNTTIATASEVKGDEEQDEKEEPEEKEEEEEAADEAEKEQEEYRDDNVSAAPNASSPVNLSESIANFAYSGSGASKCNIKCVYSNYFRGECHGSTCVCSGGKGRTNFPGECRTPRRPERNGANACNVVCVYSNFFHGRCQGSMCVCSGGKGHMTVPGHC
eukprot:TRINITY_DN1443_c0_g1_i10.p1 TRINITY_DN1443_c0_g1~~TRINITY_DN1443_c0_g1_i10.p1  ORF type:complete len:194 (+),score=60.20 TRINITY_DN1443_c0_g1_i10:152-733(+)